MVIRERNWKSWCWWEETAITKHTFDLLVLGVQQLGSPVGVMTRAGSGLVAKDHRQLTQDLLQARVTNKLYETAE